MKTIIESFFKKDLENIELNNDNEKIFRIAESKEYIKYKNITYYGYQEGKEEDWISKREIEISKWFLSRLEEDNHINTIYSSFLIKYQIVNELNKNIEFSFNKEYINITIGAIIIAMKELGYKIKIIENQCYFNFTTLSFRKLVSNDFQQMYF